MPEEIKTYDLLVLESANPAIFLLCFANSQWESGNNFMNNVKSKLGDAVFVKHLEWNGRRGGYDATVRVTDFAIDPKAIAVRIMALIDAQYTNKWLDPTIAVWWGASDPFSEYIIKSAEAEMAKIND